VSPQKLDSSIALISLRLPREVLMMKKKKKLQIENSKPKSLRRLLVLQ